MKGKWIEVKDGKKAGSCLGPDTLNRVKGQDSYLLFYCYFVSLFFTVFSRRDLLYKSAYMSQKSLLRNC